MVCFHSSSPIPIRATHLTISLIVAIVCSSSPPQTHADSSDPQSHQLLRPLPESLTSFGAATLGEYLYVFSGHQSEMHSFSKDSLSNRFRRIEFDNPNAKWQELSMDSPAQSVSLVTDGQLIYRIAGLSFHNSADEAQSFCSTDTFAAFNPETNQWKQLASLPEGRSSMDAAILGRSIYVVGGWDLQGESSKDAHWHESMLRFDLDQPELGWQSLPGPAYKIRALTVAAHENKIFAIGGMTPTGFSRKVAIYDCGNKTWSLGPELVADHAAAGFAHSSFAVGGRLFQVGASGVLYGLSRDASTWNIADRLLFPRNFLRLLPAGVDRLLAVGGTGAVGRTAAVEALTVKPEQSLQPKWASWTVDVPIAPQGQAACMHQGKLYSFGGALESSLTSESTVKPTCDAYEFDLSLQTVRPMAPVPKPIAGATAISHSSSSTHSSLYLFGGNSDLDEKSDGSEVSEGSLVWQFDPKSDSWKNSTIAFPKEITGFSCAAVDDGFWILGGSRGEEFNQSIYHWWGDESEAAPLPQVQLPNGRRDFGCVSVGNEIILVGGIGSDGQPMAEIDVFDILTRSWRQAAAPNVSRIFPQVVHCNGAIFQFGGYSLIDEKRHPMKSLEKYDLQSDSWTVVGDDLPQLSADSRMLALQGRLLFWDADPSNAAKCRFVIYDPNLPESTKEIQPMSLAGFGARSQGADQQSAKSLMRKDSDKDGFLSKEEIGKRMVSFFDSADVNRDGKLAIDEVQLAIEKTELESGKDASSEK